MASVVLGALLTATLLILLITLITRERQLLAVQAPIEHPDFIHVTRQDKAEDKERKIQKPLPPSAPPNTADIVENALLQLAVPNIPSENLNPKADLEAIGFDKGLDFSANMSFDLSDSSYVPLVKFPPTYPREARKKGIEGYVVVEFTISESGSTKDVKIVSASPRGIFDRAAIEAVKKFRYRPKKIDGQTIEVAGVRNKITFNLKNTKRN